jgi:5'-nucleotidase
LEIDYKNGKVSVVNFKLIPVNDKIKGDAKINSEIQQFKKKINSEILNPLGFSYSQVIAETSFNMYLATHAHPYPSPLGNFVSDAVKYYVNKYSTGTDVVLTADGVIREDILKGLFTPADAFRVMSLGFGKNDFSGYPLVKIYLTGRELKKLMELTIFSNKPGTDKFLYYSGIKVFYKPKGGFLNKVKKIEVGGKQIDISRKNKKLYSLTTDSYIISFIGSIKKMSHGLIKIYPKNKNGQRITDYSKYILDFNKNKPGIQEGKQWIALIDYAKSFKDINGDKIPDFPQKYKKYHSVFVPIKK